MAETSQENERKAQKLYVQLQMMQENAKNLYKQLQLVEGQFIELMTTSQSLDDFKKAKLNSEILVPLNSGIFAKAELKDNSSLIVNIGANVGVKKSVDSTKKLIERQMEEIKKIQKQMVNDLEKMTNHAAQLEMKLQGMASEG